MKPHAEHILYLLTGFEKKLLGKLKIFHNPTGCWWVSTRNVDSAFDLYIAILHVQGYQLDMDLGFIVEHFKRAD